MTDAAALRALAPDEGAKLLAWLDGQVPELGSGPLEIAFVHGGTSNVIRSIRRDGAAMILRSPPPVAPPGSEKAIMREAQVLAALNGTSVPHPTCHASCADPAILGVPFYVMEKVEGWPGDLRADRIHHPAPFAGAPHEGGVLYAMIDGLIELAKVDYKAVGLLDFGKPANFLERQVDRWESQLLSYPGRYGYTGRELPGYARLRDWLRANIPDDFTPGIIHGDVGTPNALFAYSVPARLNALIDWELSTIGDPLLDLAWVATGLRDERIAGHAPENPVYDADVMPTRQALMRHYAAGSGRNMANFDYYLLLAMFKSASILEYKVALAATGRASRQTGVFFDRLVLGTLREAERLARLVG